VPPVDPTMADSPTPTPPCGLTIRPWIKKVVVFALTILLLGWFYAWAAPHAYPKDRLLGFRHGALHGALMPMALPSLVLGKDVEIFAANNSGRPYKIGYIAGINLCGLLVFGPTFWKPGKPRA
jgi:hypothetical protein